MKKIVKFKHQSMGGKMMIKRGAFCLKIINKKKVLFHQCAQHDYHHHHHHQTENQWHSQSLKEFNNHQYWFYGNFFYGKFNSIMMIIMIIIIMFDDPWRLSLPSSIFIIVDNLIGKKIIRHNQLIHSIRNNPNCVNLEPDVEKKKTKIMKKRERERKKIFFFWIWIKNFHINISILG